METLNFWKSENARQQPVLPKIRGGAPLNVQNKLIREEGKRMEKIQLLERIRQEKASGFDRKKKKDEEEKEKVKKKKKKKKPSLFEN